MLKITIKKIAAIGTTIKPIEYSFVFLTKRSKHPCFGVGTLQHFSLIKKLKSSGDIMPQQSYCLDTSSNELHCFSKLSNSDKLKISTFEDMLIMLPHLSTHVVVIRPSPKSYGFLLRLSFLENEQKKKRANIGIIFVANNGFLRIYLNQYKFGKIFVNFLHKINKIYNIRLYIKVAQNVQKDFTEQFRIKIRENFPQNPNETIGFNRSADNRKFLEIKEHLARYVPHDRTFEKAFEKASNSLKTSRSVVNTSAKKQLEN
ncbi:hypothetical protein BpHYR1_022675 [Brachionus plicatilis]|uniref:Uncharacterized protein n=1 Tax=Brachionus plicatilis TaxID=10195 RepID=A0A3M7SJF4_BRAPC|nr:hypothetical protein BpHYR1_022675 [Brachionus plicatilis]